MTQLTGVMLETVRGYGTERSVAEGDVLFADGDARYPLIVVLAGVVALVEDHGGDHARTLLEYGPGEFPGEIGMFTGQRAYLTAAVRTAGTVIVVAPAQVEAMMERELDLSELLLRVFLGRHRRLGVHGTGITVVGRRADEVTRHLLEVLDRNRIGRRWLDPGEAQDAQRAAAVLAQAGADPDELPVVAIPGRPALARPSNRELLDALGLSSPPDGTDQTCDLLVIGAGPGGLAAAVYAGSEGFATTLVERTAFGGQAGTSTRIENYLGFPAGLSGLIATGARYNRLELDGIDRFEGAGVCYAATEPEPEPEAWACAGDEIVIVGGGNSAGQAAMFLSRGCAQVHIVIRGPALSDSMSHYLIAEIQARPNISVTTDAEVTGVIGADRLEAVMLTDRSTAQSRRLATGALFVFIGAAPCTGWLSGRLATDEDGFLLTGPQAGGGDGGREPALFAARADGLTGPV